MQKYQTWKKWTNYVSVRYDNNKLCCRPEDGFIGADRRKTTIHSLDHWYIMFWFPDIPDIITFIITDIQHTDDCYI